MSTRKTTALARRQQAAENATAMQSILVTGATGFLGAHLCAHLKEGTPASGQRSHSVRAMARQPSLRLQKLGIELMAGDVCDKAACVEAMRGITHVYHVAGFVSRRDADAPAMYRVHVEGTRNILHAAKEAGVARVVVVSTSGTVGVSTDPDEVSNEDSPYRNSTVARWPYYLSKIYQEQTAQALGRELGLEVVVVNPTLLLGPGDDRGSSTGDVEKVVRGRLPIIPDSGGIALVDVRDAAAGCVLAMEKGQPGQRYLLSAGNFTLTAFLGRVARLADVPAPRPLVSGRTLRIATGLVEGIFRRFDAEAPLDSQSVEMAEHTWYVDASRALAELGWTHRDPQLTLLDTVRDIQRRHNLKRRSEQS